MKMATVRRAKARRILAILFLLVQNPFLGANGLKMHHKPPIVGHRTGQTMETGTQHYKRRRHNHPIRNSIVVMMSSSTSPAPSSPNAEPATSTITSPTTKSDSNKTTTNLQQPKTIELYSVDVRYNHRFPLTYDHALGRYLDVSEISYLNNNNSSTSQTTNINNAQILKSKNNQLLQKWSQFLQSAFVPEGVDPSYYKFMKWRIVQRFINANVHVIGTQSLLMGLRGMQQSNIATAAAATAATVAVNGKKVASTTGAALGAAAATNWVLKDTLGKFVRMIWASKMGRKFDPDAKRWRFRSALIYAIGNGLEVSTYLHPQYFLVLAMLANSCKQMSMLTSSATRNALYNSFKMVNTGGAGVSSASSGGNGGNSIGSTSGRRNIGVENIGDITAKGEAQIAVVDLLGIASGIFLSKSIGVSVQNVVTVWIALQIMEIFCMYHEMRSIVYKTFNFERMYTVLGDLSLDDNSTGINDNDQIDAKQKSIFSHPIPTPAQIAAKEKIFLPPDHLARRAIAFGSPGRTALNPEELDMLVSDIFRGEKYFLVVGQDVKNARGLSARVRQWRRHRKNGIKDGCDSEIDLQEHCHIVLHAEANNLDIFKSALALVILRRKLVNLDDVESISSPLLRSQDCENILRETRTEVDQIFPQLLRELTKKGWHPPLRSMLGRVSVRAEWPIRKTLGLVSES